ncbi:uncharacterized protein [Aegilops tauschii subsp. strangulata]|uniref:uncharacterized protein n=1 Tax=Aegilops tauschii subsp. strangulata TaxID=200361 RepID=UPI003CC88582
MAFSDAYRDMEAHGKTMLHVIHTNDKKQMAASLEQYERHLRLQREKIIGIDLEYNNKPDATQKSSLVQLSVDKTRPVLVFQLSAAERYTVFANFLTDPRLECVNLEVANFVDIQKEWRVLEATKELDSLADVAGMLIDDYDNNMKKKITNEEHARWASLPLSMRHFEYAAKDAYAAYEIWNRITFTQDGLRHAKLEKEEPPGSVPGAAGETLPGEEAEGTGQEQT